MNALNCLRPFFLILLMTMVTACSGGDDEFEEGPVEEAGFDNSQEQLLDGEPDGNMDVVEEAEMAGGDVGAVPAEDVAITTMMPYIVETNETLASVQSKIFKDGTNTALQDPVGSSVAQVKTGDVVYYSYSEATREFTDRYEQRQSNVYVVKKGDTLSGIAKQIYGNFDAWKLIWRYSNIENPDLISVGQELHYYDNTAVAASSSDKQDSVVETELALSASPPPPIHVAQNDPKKSKQIKTAVSQPSTKAGNKQELDADIEWLQHELQASLKEGQQEEAPLTLQISKKGKGSLVKNPSIDYRAAKSKAVALDKEKPDDRL